MEKGRQRRKERVGKREKKEKVKKKRKKKEQKEDQSKKFRLIFGHSVYSLIAHKFHRCQLSSFKSVFNFNLRFQNLIMLCYVSVLFS